MCKWHVGGLKLPSFAAFDKQFNTYDWLVPLDGFMSNTFQIYKKIKTYFYFYFWSQTTTSFVHPPKLSS
jgi:hypothetical protein